MSENNVIYEELASTYEIDLDLISTIFDEVKTGSEIKLTDSSFMAQLLRPKSFPQKMNDTKFSGTPIGKRLTSIFRHNVYAKFQETLQNSKTNEKLQACQDIVSNQYNALEKHYSNAPDKLFEALRTQLCQTWNIIPLEIRNEPNLERQKSLLQQDKKTKHALILIDIIILLGFIECPLFTNIVAGEEK